MIAVALLVGSLALQWLGVVAARAVALHFSVLAKPNPLVLAHRVPVPYLGGTGLFVVYVPAVAIAAGFLGVADGLLPVVLLGAAAMALVGTVDDVVSLAPKTKLAAQFAICGLVVAFCAHDSIVEWAGFTAVAVAIVNAYNLIDVMDGLLCVVAAVGAAGLLAADLPGAADLSLFVLVAGAVALFLVNRPPARVYAGDAGALTIGFVIAVWVVDAISRSGLRHGVAIAGAVAVPMLEMLLVVLARVRVGRSPIRGSRDHFALRLQEQLRWSRWAVLAAVLPVSALFAWGPFVSRHGRVVTIVWFAASACVGTACWLACWRIPPRADEQCA